MKRFLIPSVLLAFLVLVPVCAQASILSNLLSFDGPVHWTPPLPFRGGGEDKIDDDSRSVFIDQGAAGYSTGDVIWGILTISDVQASDSDPLNVDKDVELPPNRIVFVFSAQIVGAGSYPGTFALGPIGNAGSIYDLRQLLDPSVQNGLGDNTILSVFSAVDTLNNNPLDWTPSTVETNLTAAKGWSWELTAGMAANSDDFFEFLPDPGSLSGTDRGGLTITSQAFSAVWLDVDVNDFSGTTHYNQLVLNPGVVTYEPIAGWTFTDHSTFFVNAVPEPVSLLTWAGLAGIGAVFAARRRRES